MYSIESVGRNTTTRRLGDLVFQKKQEQETQTIQEFDGRKKARKGEKKGDRMFETRWWGKEDVSNAK